MVQIPVNIPDDRVQLVRDAVTFYMRNEAGDQELEVTGPEAIAWMSDKLIDEVKRLTKNHQRQIHSGLFTFNDPTGE